MRGSSVWAESCPFGRSEQRFLASVLTLRESFAAAMHQLKVTSLVAELGVPWHIEMGQGAANSGSRVKRGSDGKSSTFRMKRPSD
tara:strand:+ start:565 stop:819 length:255 start_codon:yes stop_codon:yes gene_type:complete